MFTGATREHTAFEIDLHEIPQSILLPILEYCYTDDIRYVRGDMAVDLLMAANRFWYEVIR